LRRGNIENSLIFYARENKKGPKNSHVRIFRTENGRALGELLSASLGVLVEVEKRREIYFIGNVKFHIDRVPRLGSFVEIEAIDSTGRIGRAKLLRQCNNYLKLFGISENDLVQYSYSDLLTVK
jgi:predicted adenylyl cyclase CyaB